MGLFTIAPSTNSHRHTAVRRLRFPRPATANARLAASVPALAFGKAECGQGSPEFARHCLCPWYESNVHIRLRSPEFYPLNYRGEGKGGQKSREAPRIWQTHAAARAMTARTGRGLRPQAALSVAEGTLPVKSARAERDGACWGAPLLLCERGGQYAMC